ncbi:thiamine-phosphate kinase [Gracilimonas sp. Q87]|uniref:thiamine-phosphate kinase n=1 Tax=Gracilimonas sp. Q87 TaxID=3384766 RepID=UPI0039845A7F
MSDTFQTIQSIGAKNLLDKLTDFDSYKSDNVIQSVGDDSAVIEEKDGDLTLLTSETFVEGVDFDPTYTPFHHLGYKIVSAGVSDIYAMNGMPETMLINLAAPNRMSVQMIEDLYKGIYAAGKEHEVELVGGDMKANHANLVVSISIYGKVDQNVISYRKGAEDGDAICITGDLGGALAGLRILMREKKFWEEHGDDAVQPELGDYQFVVKRQLVPKARRDLVYNLRDNNLVPSSMIDLSKGLVSELSALCDASSLGATIYQAALPIAIETRQVADEMKEDVDRYALFGGEDFELMFTLPEKQVEAFANKFNDFVVIGRMRPEEEGMKMQTAEGDLVSFDELS